MKKLGLILILVLFVGVCAGWAVPIDFGVDIKNTTGLTRYGPLVFTQEDTASLWFSAQPGKVLKLAIQGSYTFDLNRYYLFELDLAKIEANLIRYGDTPFRFRVEGGRFYFTDFTRKVLAHNLDGLRFTFGLPFMRAEVAAGYAGLSGKVGSEIIMSKADATDKSDDTVFFAPYRVIETVTLKFPELFLRQNLTISTVLQQDVRPVTNLAQAGDTTFSDSYGGRVSTQYFGLGLSGPLVRGLYHNVYGYLGTGQTLSYIDSSYQQAVILSYLVGTDLTLFLPKALQSRLRAAFVYSSGDADSTEYIEANSAGFSQQFIPISRPSFAMAFSPQLGNIFYIDVSYWFKPLSYLENSFGKNFQVLLKGVPTFRSTPAPISHSGLNPSSTALYLGTELDAIFNFRIFSDLGLSVTTGFFMPNTWAFTDNSTQILAEMELSISM